MSEWDFI